MFKEYRETFSQVTASEDVYRRVRNMNKNSERRLRRVPRLALIAAMVLLLTACAVGFNALDMLEAAFGRKGQERIAEEKIVGYRDEEGHDWFFLVPEMERIGFDEALAEKLVEPYVVQISGSVTNSQDGTVLSVEAYLHDPSTKTCIVYLNMENQNGLPEYEVSGTGWLHWDRETVGLHYLMSDPFGYYFLDEERSTETKQYLTLRFAYEETLSELDIKFTKTQETLNIPISDCDLRSISMDDGNVIISPVGMYTKAKIAERLSIQYQDGTEYVVKDETIKRIGTHYQHVRIGNYYYATSLGDSVCNTSWGLNRIVDIDNVKSIIIDGKEYFPD